MRRPTSRCRGRVDPGPGVGVDESEGDVLDLLAVALERRAVGKISLI